MADQPVFPIRCNNSAGSAEGRSIGGRRIRRASSSISSRTFRARPSRRPKPGEQRVGERDLHEDQFRRSRGPPHHGRVRIGAPFRLLPVPLKHVGPALPRCSACCSPLSGCFPVGIGGENTTPLAATSVHTMAFRRAGTAPTGVHKPPGLAAAAPLVVMLHGGDRPPASKAEKLLWLGFNWPIRRSSSVAYPDGIGRSWNGHGCCGKAMRENIDDVRLHHRDGRGRSAPTCQSTSCRVLCRRDSANGGHHELRAGLQQRHLRGHRPGFGHHARRLFRATSDVGDPHPRPPPTSWSPYHGGNATRRSPTGRRSPDVNAFLAQGRSVRRSQCHDQRPPLTTIDRRPAPTSGSVELITIDGGKHQWPGGTTFLEKGATRRRTS